MRQLLSGTNDQRQPFNLPTRYQGREALMRSFAPVMDGAENLKFKNIKIFPVRNVGGSVGISLITTLAARFAQARQTTLVSHVTPYDTSYQFLVSTASGLYAAHDDKVTAQQQTLGSIYHQVLTQANFLAYLDIFRWFVLLCFVCAIGGLILKNVTVHGPVAVH